MKKFINEHPKLYWMIVGVLAVVVFSIVTAIGCAKLEKANASESYVPDWRTEIKGNASYIDATLDYNYCFVTLEGSSITFFRYVFCNDFRVETHNGIYYLAPYDYQTHNVVQSDLSSVGYAYGDKQWCDVTLSGDVYKCSKIVASNWDWRGDNAELAGYKAGGLDYPSAPKPPMQYSYLVNAPYAVIDDYENYNVFLEYPRGEIDMSEFKVEFSLGGQPMNPENGYKMEYTLYVWLPSADYIRGKYGLLMEQDFLQNVLLSQDCYDADVLEWQKNVGTNGDSVLYKIPLTYDIYNNPETGESGQYRIKFDYKDLLDNMEYKLGDGETDFSFREYYGRSESEWAGWVRKMVFGHALISRMDALVYTQIDDADTYYGRTTTFTFLRNGNFVYSEVNKDALNEDINSDLSDGINNALQEGLIQSGDKVDELQQNINNVSGSLGSFDTEFEGVDLWNGIKGFGSGLIGLTGFLGNVATALGSVFVFMPYDVRQLVGYFFMASLVVALWKLIKR